MTCKCTDLDTLLVEPEVVHLTAAVRVCRQTLKDIVPDLESWASSNNIQKCRKCHRQDIQSFCMLQETHLFHPCHLRQWQALRVSTLPRSEMD
jgi:hypothetical protein